LARPQSGNTLLRKIILRLKDVTAIPIGGHNGALICNITARVLLALIAAVFVSWAQNSIDIGHLVVSHLQSGKYVEAKDLVERALKNSPSDARLWTLDGLTLVRLRLEDDALAAFERALQISPDYLPALEGAAEIAYQAGKGEAAPLLRRVLKLRPNDQMAHAMLAGTAFKQGDCETAKIEFAASQSPLTREVSGLEEFGACLVKQKRIAEALPVFEHLCELQPTSAKALYQFAVVQFLTGHYAGAVTTLTSPAFEASPDADALDLLAEAYESLSDTQRARAASRQAIALRPSVPRYYADLAYICLAHQQFQQGLEVANEGLQRNPNAASLYVVRGILYSELAQYDKGLSDFTTAEQLDPNVELSSEARGLAGLQQNDLPETEKTIRDRIRQHPENGFLYYLLGETLRKKGAAPGTADFDEAVQAFRRGIELDPHLILARDALAALYLVAGKPEDAVEQSRLAYHDNPNDQTAIYHLILALRKINYTDEIPALTKQLARLKQAGQAQGLPEQR
jgi:tetratricopeptide (TPR) repeat protein